MRMFRSTALVSLVLLSLLMMAIPPTSSALTGPDHLDIPQDREGGTIEEEGDETTSPKNARELDPGDVYYGHLDRVVDRRDYFIVTALQGQVVNVRQGPSVNYPIVGQVRSGEIYTVVGRNDTGTWWQICCYDGLEVWISGQLVEVSGDQGQVLIAAVPPPPPTPVPQPTQVAAATPGPYLPFDIGDGPHMFESANPWLTVWVKAFTGKPPIFLPVEGYRLKVFRNGVDVSSQDTTRGVFELWAPFDPEKPYAFGTRREYNLKYEFFPEAGEAEWRIYLANAGGRQVSPEFTFRTGGDSKVREVYVGFFDLRPL